MEKHIEGWKKEKENISCKDIGLSFAHLKMACEDLDLAIFDWKMLKLPMEKNFCHYFTVVLHIVKY